MDFKDSMKLVKEKVTFRQVLDNLGITVKSENKPIKCVFHKDDTPSLKFYSLDSGEGNFFCFGCRATGDLLTFYSKYTKMSNIEALKKLCSIFNITLGNSSEHPSGTSSLSGKVYHMLHADSKKKERPVLSDSEGLWKTQTLLTNILSQPVEQRHGTTPYLERKKLPHLCSLSRGSMLYIPYYSLDGTLKGVQNILSTGAKFFASGCDVKNNMLILPNGSGLDFVGVEKAFLCEGWATGASVYLSTGITTFVCFTSWNIPNVARQLSNLYPDMELVVAGDNDGPGKRHGLPGIYPPLKKQDWSDIWVSEGKEGVLKYLVDTRVEKVYTSDIREKVVSGLTKLRGF